MEASSVGSFWSKETLQRASKEQISLSGVNSFLARADTSLHQVTAYVSLHFRILFLTTCDP